MARSTSTRHSAVGSPSTLSSMLLPQKRIVPNPSPLYFTPAEIRHHTMYSGLDRRRYHPQTLFRPADAMTRSATRLLIDKLGNNIRRQMLTPMVRFAEPHKVGICLRRKIRREVIHALRLKRKVGKGGKRKRHPYSSIKC